MDFEPRALPCSSFGCTYYLSPTDDHSKCMFCLGLFHARDAFEKPGWCPACSTMTDREKGRRLARVKAYEDRALCGDPDVRGGRPHDPAPPLWRPVPPPRARLAVGRGRPLPAASSMDRDLDYEPPPARKIPRTAPGPCRGSAQRLAPSFSYSAVRTERSFASGSLSYSRDDLSYRVETDDDDLPDLPPREIDDWGDHVDDCRPVENASPFRPPDEFQVLDQVGFGEDDGPDGDIEDGELLDADIPPPAPEPVPVQPPPQVQDDVAPPFPAADDWDLVELLKRAATRSDHVWPVAAPPPDPEDSWPGAETRAPSRKVILPLARGFKATFTASWENPTGKPTYVVKPTFDMDAMPSLGLDALATVGPTVGAYLNDPRAPRIRPLAREPTLPSRSDQEASKAAGRMYDLVISQAKHLNAASLLQMSLTNILEGIGAAPKPEHAPLLAEASRIHQELIKFSCATASLSGRIASSILIAERSRWLNSSPTLDATIRKDLLEAPIQAGGLFKGAVEKMALAVEEQRPGVEALTSFAPPRPPRPPRNQPRDFLPRQVQRPQRQYQQGGGGGRRNANQPQRPRQDDSGGARAPPRDASADTRDRRPAEPRRGPPAAPAGAKKGTGKSNRGQQRK